MTPKPGSRILIVEDNSSMAALYGAYIKRAGFEVEVVNNGAKALASVRASAPAALVLDLNLPDMNGRQVLEFCIAEGVPTSVIVVTTDGSIDNAVKAMRGGAYDFIVKPFSSDRLVSTVRNAVERSTLKTAVEEMRDSFGQKRFCGFLGESPAMQNVYRAIAAAAPSNATIFVSGESGTGKELAAEAIHQMSRRRNGPLLAINCGAISKDLIESELFGHLKGSFTGAAADHAGAVRQAHGGTLFLDEICEMQIDLQTKLLRFLQTGTFRCVGATRTEKADIRVVCATNRDPIAEVKAGRFREDLYYRLHVVPIVMPPLREREDDAVLIAEEFLKRYAAEENRAFRSFSSGALTALRACGWPGNVRQLQNVLRNAIILNEAEQLTAEMLPLPGSLNLPGVARVAGRGTAPDRPAENSSAPVHGSWRVASDIIALPDVERAAIERAIAICDGNIPRAAAFLRVSPSTIYRKKQLWFDGPAAPA